ncbi:serine hydrolase domain-containing protein, partial [Xanthovirga aplysinae]|uniref:serine hydrolase domain-containing protein n=1 Tax=Xanthovirga aplysinae TaxID=2529853 RepID=UPI0012BCA5F0
MKNPLLIILIFVVLGCSSPSVYKGNINVKGKAILTEFEHLLNKALKEDNFRGSISAAIVKGNKVIWSNAYGLADNDNNIFADTTTIYRAGSITKSFTAVLMMQLIEQNIIKLSDPLELYLPEIQNLEGYSGETKITFQHLASHTSGLVREPKMKGVASGPFNQWESKLLEAINNTGFQSKPGEKYQYSNIGYGLLGLALSRAAGMPYTELIEEHLFKPLKLNNAYFIVPKERMEKVAKGMAGKPGNINKESPAKQHSGRGYKVPNGAIYSTPNDLAKFIMGNMGYFDLLSKESLELMQTVYTPEGSEENYGLGFKIFQTDDMKIINHGGSISGYKAQLCFDRKSSYGVVLMVNYNKKK